MNIVEASDRVAQLLFFNTGVDPVFVEKEDLSATEWEKGFGHTGKWHWQIVHALYFLK